MPYIMTELEAIRARHSVRSYTAAPIEDDLVRELRDQIDLLNEQSGLSMQLACDKEPPFALALRAMRTFKGVRNWVALFGHEAPDLFERIGYYGEKLVICAQRLGLSTCWVAMASQRAAKAALGCADDLKLACIVTIGHAADPGVAHRDRSKSDVSAIDPAVKGGAPAWFEKGLEAAMLAPTAVNQQRFLLTLLPGDKVRAEATGNKMSRLDLGIVKYHFEVGAGRDSFSWA